MYMNEYMNGHFDSGPGGVWARGASIAYECTVENGVTMKKKRKEIASLG